MGGVLGHAVRVLADRHHAGLYHSLELLGDRLGWDLWTPVGEEWFSEGYWSFGRKHFGRELADQYLAIGDAAWSRWQGADGTYQRVDREYPDREIKGITLEAAKSMTWDIVMATVQENQEGFARFAREVGAQYAYQVGNTNQQIDWSLDPSALVSAESPIVGRGVRYHQEMDASYRWHPPSEADRYRVGSFVNLMPRIECWPLMFQAWQALQPAFTFSIHGHGCPDGIVHPTTAVAQAMAGFGWGWMDKITGDGFGHVIWGWAAVGRPIIGHASHYRGKLGEVLWRDGETCIDLDKHSITETAQLIRDISADPDRHAAMCDQIRRAFEAHYDPERDARAIGELLARGAA